MVWNFLYLPIIQKVNVDKNLNSKICYEFQEKIKNLNFDYDWFTNHIPTWLKAFESSKFNKKSFTMLRNWFMARYVSIFHAQLF